MGQIGQWLRRAVGGRRLGSLQAEPVSRLFGFDRGTPIDRHYIREFLSLNRDAFRGTVMEVGDDQYSQLFKTPSIHKTIVVGASSPTLSEPMVVPVDFATGVGLSDEMADCLILTQVLPFIYDVRSALTNIHRLLRPGGVVLSTFGGISQISRFDMDRWGDYWRFTDASAKRLFSEVFDPSDVVVSTYGNVASAKAFLDGLSSEELPRELLSAHDPDYQVTICVRAEKR
jgi:hypothetical protein